MISQPSLDRFNQRGPYERYGVKVLLMPPECDVCGQPVPVEHMRQWQGKEVCTYCLSDIERESVNE